MNEPVTINLIPGRVEDVLGGTNSENDTADMKLTVPIHNNGNHLLRTNFDVTFYSDEDLTQVIGTATVEGPSEDTLGLQGCAVQSMPASVIWSNLPVGNHRFWAKIDPLDQINESNETDNITSLEVLVLPAQLYFPAVNRN